MSRARVVTILAFALGVLSGTAELASAQGLQPDREGFLIARPADLVPPEGGRTVNLMGNPSEPGLYVIQLTWRPGSGSRPHYHDQGRYIQVLKGTWYVSTGAASDIYAPDTMIPVEEGTFIYEPPGGHHYDMAKDEEVVVMIWGMGPVSTTSIPQPENGADR